MCQARLPPRAAVTAPTFACAPVRTCADRVQRTSLLLLFRLPATRGRLRQPCGPVSRPGSALSSDRLETGGPDRVERGPTGPEDLAVSHSWPKGPPTPPARPAREGGPGRRVSSPVGTMTTGAGPRSGHRPDINRWSSAAPARPTAPGPRRQGGVGLAVGQTAKSEADMAKLASDVGREPPSDGGATGPRPRRPRANVRRSHPTPLERPRRAPGHVGLLAHPARLATLSACRSPAFHARSRARRSRSSWRASSAVGSSPLVMHVRDFLGHVAQFGQ